MAWPWAFGFLALLQYWSGVRSQPAVTQPSSTSVPLSGITKISCDTSNGGSWDSFSWYQQPTGSRPRFLVSGSTKGEGVPDRFSAASSGNNGYLTIRDAQEDDEAIYFCLNWSNTDRAYIFGGGTSLSVIGQPVTPPTVRVFPPSPEEITTKNTATLVCLIEGFYPASTNVAWSADGTDITRNVETAKPTKQGEKYVSSSYLTMTAPEYNSHDNYKCKVTHEGKTFEQSIKRS